MQPSHKFVRYLGNQANIPTAALGSTAAAKVSNEQSRVPKQHFRKHVSDFKPSGINWVVWAETVSAGQTETGYLCEEQQKP